jgi:hypothetical protein
MAILKEKIMKLWICTLVGLTVGWGVGENIAQAQTWQLGTYSPPQVRKNPPVSPYINLGLGASAIDYYGIVRPQMEAYRSFGQLQQGLINLQSDVNNPAAFGQTLTPPGGLQTGHPVTYNNYQRFFPMTYGTSSGNLGAGGYQGGNPTTGMTGSQQGYSPFYGSNLNTTFRR